MTSDEALQRFGLPASPHHRDELRQLLGEEIGREMRGESGDEMLRTLCLQLFSLGVAEDALLIWDAKMSSFDAGCGLDVQFLCGTGLAETKAFLAQSRSLSAPAALQCITKCEQSGDFAGWTPQVSIDDYRAYYGLARPSSAQTDIDPTPSQRTSWPTASRGVGLILFATVIYFGFCPLLWLPFVATARAGKPLPWTAQTFFRPAGFLFDHCEPYTWLINWEAKILGVDDIDYEGRILGSN